MKRFSLLLITLTSLVLTGCLSGEVSADVNQDRIKTDYELVYDANRDVTGAVARFTFGGSALSLSNGSTVTFNGVQLSERPGVGSYYATEFPGVVEEGAFVWTDADGVTYTNPVTLPAPVTLSANTGPLSRSRSTEVFWDGLDVQTNEFMALFPYRGAGYDFELSYASTSDEGATSLLVTPDKLAGVTPGEVTLSLTRVRDLGATDAPSAGGSVRGRYIAPDVQTQIVE